MAPADQPDADLHRRGIGPGGPGPVSGPRRVGGDEGAAIVPGQPHGHPGETADPGGAAAHRLQDVVQVEAPGYLPRHGQDVVQLAGLGLDALLGGVLAVARRAQGAAHQVDAGGDAPELGGPVEGQRRVEVAAGDRLRGGHDARHGIHHDGAQGPALARHDDDQSRPQRHHDGQADCEGHSLAALERVPVGGQALADRPLLDPVGVEQHLALVQEGAEGGRAGGGAAGGHDAGPPRNPRLLGHPHLEERGGPGGIRPHVAVQGGVLGRHGGLALAVGLEEARVVGQQVSPQARLLVEEPGVGRLQGAPRRRVTLLVRPHHAEDVGEGPGQDEGHHPGREQKAAEGALHAAGNARGAAALPFGHIGRILPKRAASAPGR